MIHRQLLPSHSPEIPCHPSNGVHSERLWLVEWFISLIGYILAHVWILCYLLTFCMAWHGMALHCRLQHCAGLTMSVCGADVRPVEWVRDLGVLIDSNMTLLNHVNNVAGICFYQLRQLRIIRRSLTTEAAHSLVRALIHARVDYCNGLHASGPEVPARKVTVCLPCRRQASSAAPASRICFRHHASTVAMGSRCQIASSSNCVRSCSDASTDSHLGTCRTSARPPRCTLTSDHLWHLKDLC